MEQNTEQHVPTLEEILTEIERTFNEYARQHRAKDTEEGLRKAFANLDRAKEVAVALKMVEQLRKEKMDAEKMFTKAQAASKLFEEWFQKYQKQAHEERKAHDLTKRLLEKQRERSRRLEAELRNIADLPDPERGETLPPVQNWNDFEAGVRSAANFAKLALIH